MQKENEAMGYTEDHAGIPVIRDRALYPQMVKKLAELEDMRTSGRRCVMSTASTRASVPTRKRWTTSVRPVNWRNCLRCWVEVREKNVYRGEHGKSG